MTTTLSAVQRLKIYLPAFWVVLIDQVSKHFAEAKLSLHEPVALLPGLNLTLMYNEGAAFSFLSDAGGWQRWFFVALALGVSAWLVIWLWRLSATGPRTGFGLALILGGAMGNVMDRLALGHVVDFIDVYWNAWHWPAFNVADSAISVGVVLMLLDNWGAVRRGRR
jgi:signal peptidase II